jgi:hypothetical protein
MRFQLLGPALTIHALYELLREIDNPLAHVVSIQQQRVWFKIYWYAVVDNNPVLAVLPEFDDGFEALQGRFEGFTPDMA